MNDKTNGNKVFLNFYSMCPFFKLKLKKGSELYHNITSYDELKVLTKIIPYTQNTHLHAMEDGNSLSWSILN